MKRVQLLKGNARYPIGAGVLARIQERMPEHRRGVFEKCIKHMTFREIGAVDYSMPAHNLRWQGSFVFEFKVAGRCNAKLGQLASANNVEYRDGVLLRDCSSHISIVSL